MNILLCGKFCQYGIGCDVGVPICVLGKEHEGKCLCGCRRCGENVEFFCDQNVTDQTLFKDISTCNVRTISLSACQRISGMYWTNNLLGFMSLTILNISQQRNFTGYLFANVNFPYLSKLDIRECPLIDCKGWKDIPNLKHLLIGCNPRMNLVDWTSKTFRLKTFEILNRTGHRSMDMSNSDIFGNSPEELRRFDDLESLKISCVDGLDGEAWPNCGKLTRLVLNQVPLNDSVFKTDREYPLLNYLEIHQTKLKNPQFSDSIFQNLEEFLNYKNHEFYNIPFFRKKFRSLKKVCFAYNTYGSRESPVKHPLDGEECEYMVNIPLRVLRDFCPENCDIVLQGDFQCNKKK